MPQVIKSIRHLIAATLLMLPGMAMAYTVSGTIIDSEAEPMIQASVRILTPRDSTAVKTVISNERGAFVASDVKRGKYILEVSYVGYSTYTRNFDVTDRAIDLGQITLHESSIMLAEAVVKGIKTPITVKEDTIEFNADSYRTAPNAVVEDLLKRLPGVEVGSDGKITANGKEVSKILIDGKEFFSDDPKVASKNLPVNMVDKLQVVDRKSDLARMTGVDDGEDETVINLTVKKGMKDGWFGNVEAGYGTSNRYNGSFVVNRFQNENQFTLLGGANNTNDPPFTDQGMSRFRRFGSDNGVTSSQAGGFNFNVGRSEKFRVGGNVMYSRSDRDSHTERERQYFLTDGDTYNSEKKNARDIGNGVRADFRLQWKPDSLNTLDFRPNFSYNHNQSWSDDEALAYRFAQTGAREDMTLNTNRNKSWAHSVEFGGRLIYNHNFRSRPGRSLSFMGNYRFSNTHEYEDAYSIIKYYLSEDADEVTDRYLDERTWSNSINARLTWTEPIGAASKGNFLTFAYALQMRWNNADKLTYDVTDEATGSGLVLDNDLSNRFRNDYISHDVRVGYKHVSAKSNLDVGFSLVPQRSSSTDLIDDARSIPVRNVLNYSPFLRYRLKLSKTRSFTANYRGRSSQPTMAQLQPVADVSNPLNVVQGNPELNPSFTHNVNLRFQDFNSEAQRSIMAMVFANMTQNAIISRTTLNPETGGRYTTYENVNGTWNVRAMNMISLPLKNRQFTFNNHLMLNYANSVGYNNNERNRSNSFGFNESFGFAWRPDNTELELRPNYSLQTVQNSVTTSGNRTTHRYGGTFNGTYYTRFGLVINTDLTYTATSGYSEGYNTREWMWNASVGYQFLRNRAATITLKAYDILGQRSNVSRDITANYMDDIRYNSLTRYVMLTFAYKFNTMGKNAPSGQRGFGPGGPDGPMPAGGPPMGGPGGPPPRM